MSTPRACKTRRLHVLGPRRGATLLELLTVIIVLLMITAATVPIVSPHVEGRRIREGARMLSAFINSARNRAFETGRAAGIWIERMPNLPEAANTIHYAEIPPLYAGDFLDSTAECFVVGKQTAATSWPNTTDREYYNIVVPRSRTAYQTDLWANPDSTQQQLVRDGDQIRFEGNDSFYTLRVVDNLTVPNSSQKKWWYLLKGINSNSINGTYDNDVDIYGRYTIRWYGGPSGSSYGHGSVVRTTTQPMTNNAVGIRYQIYRQPIRLQAGSMQLPDGIVIDLNFSSVTNGENTDSGIPFHPRTGTNNLFIGNAFYPDDNTPIVIVFSPDGQVVRLYRQTKEAAANRYSWQGTEPYGEIYLLVGERGNVVPHETDASLPTQIKKNWLNLDALWVKINAQSGLTSTSLVDNTTTTNGTNPLNVHTTRGKSRGVRTVGGR